MPSWMRTRPWWVPLAFLLVLGAVGMSTIRAVEAAAREQVRTQLQTMLDANIAALDVWLTSQRAVAEDLAADPELVDAMRRLQEQFRGEGREALVSSGAAYEIVAIVEGVVDRHAFLGWRMYDADMVCLAGSDTEALGRVLPVNHRDLERMDTGETIATPPISAVGEDLVAAPAGVIAILSGLFDAAGHRVGAVAFGIDSATTFARPLEVARMGESGETYAFSAAGRLLSPSRFESQLRDVGLLPDDPAVRSFMNIEIRDPGGDLGAGYVPELPVLARPLTRMAASAANGESGFDLDGYRDYRGVVVVGAWRWLPELDLGIASEMDLAEAYATLAPVRIRIGGLMGLLGLAALGMLVYSLTLRRIQGDLAAARRLGRYRIESVIGRGGMGTVYRARHALLRRPTAIKVLRPDHMGAEAVARFEREVQVTSQLTHPNTVEIYDFGETPEGLFYYAMEYLGGATLRELVDRGGRMPEARVLFVLRQMCGSLAEAHRAGMVHRDIKPSNVMLTERGGLLDFVKVVDFGLVKPLGGSVEETLTRAESMTGTPLYMPPEMIRSADETGPRSDVYQIGAVAWFALAGRHVFEGARVIEVLDQHLNVPAGSPSAAAGAPIDPGLEALVLRCLAKAPADRPADAGELLAALELLELTDVWSQTDASAFWAEWADGAGVDGGTDGDSAPMRVGDSLDIAERLGEAGRP